MEESDEWVLDEAERSKGEEDEFYLTHEVVKKYSYLRL